MRSSELRARGDSRAAFCKRVLCKMHVRAFWGLIVVWCVVAAGCKRPYASAGAGHETHAVVVGKAMAKRRAHATALLSPIAVSAAVPTPFVPRAVANEPFHTYADPLALAATITHGSRAPPRV